MNDDALLGFRDPTDVCLAHLEGAVLQAVRHADELARRRVRYRRVGRFGRADLGRPAKALSCSELVYYAYARAGARLGAGHQRTRRLAFDEPPPYADAMVKVTQGPLLPGDLLVYHRERAVVQAEVAGRPRGLAGHVVILVSEAERLVIGSHGRTSTPTGAPTGVGYRTTEAGLSRWTGNRTLQAVFRLAS